ncbi:MAG TPA: fumarylacetoacetate hydrolase family protein, partial [Ferroplasma sp.]|nr:fumarylacetoacetate hydrolase family protein [Ferroplasma sp.]
CILELGPEKYGWLKAGDEVRLESKQLGNLVNRVV